MHVTLSANRSSGLTTPEINLTFDVAAETRAFLHPEVTRACDLCGEKEVKETRVFPPQTSSTTRTTPSISMKNDKILGFSISDCQRAFDVAPEIKAFPEIEPFSETKVFPSGLRPKYTSDSEFYVENNIEEEHSPVAMKEEYKSMAERGKEVLAALRSSLEKQIKREDMEAQEIEDDGSKDDDSEEDGVESPVIEMGASEIVDIEDYFADTEDADRDTDDEDSDDEDDEEALESRTGLGEPPSHDRLKNEYMSIAAEILADLAKIRASIQAEVEREIAEEAARKPFVDEV